MADPKKFVDDAEDAVKKGARAVGDAYRNLPSVNDVKSGATAAASALSAMRGMQADPTQIKPPEQSDVMRDIWSRLAQAQGYYRGYVKPKIDQAWRDIQKRLPQ